MASTGEPQTDRQLWSVAKVYPRVHGGTTLAACLLPSVLGLSPRARGNLGTSRTSPTHTGSIPACTGEPRTWSASSSPLTVYPRVHGGTPHEAGTPERRPGLSPRARGNHAFDAVGGTPERSIPACTGEPCSIVPPQRIHEVYPRVHGGTCASSAGQDTRAGLSPRARGNRARRGLPL